jgi:predicted DNA-binding transcriptional regulator AlpA
MAENNNYVDFVRSREETAKILNTSTRTLSRWEKLGMAPRRTQLSERIIGYRDSAIREFLDAKTMP